MRISLGAIIAVGLFGCIAVEPPASTDSMPVDTDTNTEIEGEPISEAVQPFMGGPVTTYTRWGRDDCPAGATLVYSGYAAGSWYNYTGGSSDTLCLTNEPTFVGFTAGVQGGNALYGTEFNTNGFGVPSMTLAHNGDGVCAVCMAPRSVSLMVPGTAECPAGWQLEYWGYLMSNSHTQGRATTVCVDKAPDLVALQTNSDGNLWYPTEGRCGALPCGPYVDGIELTCAVCTY